MLIFIEEPITTKTTSKQRIQELGITQKKLIEL